VRGGSSARHADIAEEVKRCLHGTAIPMTVTIMTRPERGRDDHGWPSPPDPGDLSRRVAQRRAELHLTQAQVEARAGLSPRYLEYLERYPARPARPRSGSSPRRCGPRRPRCSAHRVAHPAELRRLQEDAAVWPWPGGEREVYVRIVPREITGRRIELRHAP
jgi:hypothetical protein